MSIYPRGPNFFLTLSILLFFIHPQPQAYVFNPLANLTSTQVKLVLGGQQLL